MASEFLGLSSFNLPGVNTGDFQTDTHYLPGVQYSAPAPPPQGLPILEVEEGNPVELDSAACVRRPPITRPERGGEQHPLISWFEQEVRPELLGIRRDLDQLLSRAGDKATAFPKSRACTRKMTESSTRSRSGAEDKRAAFKKALSSLSCLSSIDSSTECKPSSVTSALGAVLLCTPDSSKKELLRQHTLQLADVFPAASPTVSRDGSGHSAIGAVGRRNSGESMLSVKELEKAVVLSRFHRRRLKMFETAWNMLEDPESSRVARLCARVMPPFIIFSVCVTLLQLVHPPPLHGLPAAILETSIETIFLLEFLLRLVVCPNPWTFWLDVFNLVDLAVAAPLALRLCIGPVLPESEELSWGLGILYCAVPIVRLLKLLRRFEKFHLLLNAFNLAAEALPVLLFMLFVIELIFSMLLYLVEPRDNIPSLATAVWLTMVTMTTVGYGDVTPTSMSGSIITGVLVVITVLYMAIPLGIIGNAFTATWNERDRILLMQRTRERLRQWGYSAHDIPVLFRLSDSNDDGELDVTEFRDLLQSMKIGFSDERIFQLFSSFDQDHSGTVDDKEFVRALFPNSYHDIYREEGAV